MAILRKTNKQKYTTILHSVTLDSNLSLKDLGLLVKLLSLPDNWEFSEKGLEKILKKDGQTAIRTAIKNLEKYGYLKRVRTRDERGKVAGVEWYIYEEPQPINEGENPHFENHSLDNPNWVNHPQYNIKESNIKESNINIVKESKKEKNAPKRFSPPSIEEVKEYCKERGNNIDPEQFVAFYSSKGWKVGNNNMKDWKAAVITWEKRDKQSKSKAQNNHNQSFKTKDLQHNPFAEQEAGGDLENDETFRALFRLDKQGG